MGLRPPEDLRTAFAFVEVFEAIMTICFGAFTLDSDARQLFRDGQSVHLAPKAFDFLTILVNSRPKALSKAELHATLWPDTFVSDGNLARVVADLRSVMGDTDNTNGLVRTVHGYGYAFNGEAVDRPTPRSSASLARCWLVWSTGDVRLRAGESIIGRDPDSTVWLDLAGVSRRHARILLSGTGAVLEDLASKNGTFLGDTLLTGPVSLSHDDHIRVASMTLIFRTRPAERLTVTEQL